MAKRSDMRNEIQTHQDSAALVVPEKPHVHENMLSQEQRKECLAVARDLRALIQSEYDPEADPRAVIERIAAAFSVLGGG